MNIGHAIRLCRTQRKVPQTDVAQRANCSVSYLSMLEENKRDPTLSTLTKIASASHAPIGVLFAFASEHEHLGKVDMRLTGAHTQSALASLGYKPEPTHAGGHHG